MGEEWFALATPCHFWMVRRFEVLKTLCCARLNTHPRCCEIGCGNGVLQAQIEAEYGIAVDGFDLHLGALEQNISSQGQLYYYDVREENPEFQHRYDAIFLFDVIEHIEQEVEFLRSCRFHLHPAGAIIIHVPARRELFSKYDLAAGHVRRYTLKRLERLAGLVNMRVAERTYWGFPLYPLLLARKFLVRRGSDSSVLRAGFSPTTGVVNSLLLWLARAEFIPQRMLGTSILAVFENVSP
jgi:SAM-dependent methyltransferase